MNTRIPLHFHKYTPDGREIMRLRRVPSETIFQADDFSVDALPVDTTAVVLDVRPEVCEFPLISPDELVVLRRNERHRRSFELLTDLAPVEPGVATTLKGADWSYPSTIQTGGYLPLVNVEYRGGMLRCEAEKAVKTAEKLEEWGIHGERVKRIDAPEVLAIDGVIEPTSTVIHSVARNSRISSQTLLGVLLQRKSRQPVTMVRTMPVDIRLQDVFSARHDQLHEQIQAGMDRVGQLEPIYDGMQAGLSEDAFAFFREALPRVYGEQLGKLHAHGYRQRWSHPGNIPLDGGVIDLDGVGPGRSNMRKYVGHLSDGCITALNHYDYEGMCDTTRRPSFSAAVAKNFEDAFVAGSQQ